MKQSLQIEAVVEQPQLLENMVERLVGNKAPYDVAELVTEGWKEAPVASAETYVSCTVMLDDENAHIALPFTTSFLFSCIKDEDGRYKIEWACSMS